MRSPYTRLSTGVLPVCATKSSISQLTMNGYSHSSCHENTALACIVCSKALLAISAAGCKHALTDGYNRRDLWYRSTTCSRCMAKIHSSTATPCRGIVGAGVVLNSPAYKNVSQRLKAFPRLYSVCGLHPVEDLKSLVNRIARSAKTIIIVTDPTVSAYNACIEEF